MYKLLKSERILELYYEALINLVFTSKTKSSAKREEASACALCPKRNDVDNSSSTCLKIKIPLKILKKMIRYLAGHAEDAIKAKARDKTSDDH